MKIESLDVLKAQQVIESKALNQWTAIVDRKEVEEDWDKTMTDHQWQFLIHLLDKGVYYTIDSIIGNYMEEVK